MPGFSAAGRPLDGWAHVSQSIQNIITTPVGSRVMRRDYGCRLTDLIDRPMGAQSTLMWTSRIAEALDKWEPRFVLKRVIVTKAGPEGHFVLDVYGEHVPDGHLVPRNGRRKGSYQSLRVSIDMMASYFRTPVKGEPT